MEVGFIGLGNVGGKLAGSLLRSGFDLAVHDLDPAEDPRTGELMGLEDDQGVRSLHFG